MIKENKKISDLTDDNLEYIFNIVFPQIPQEVRSFRIINIYKKYVVVSNLGCTMVLWDDYRIKIFSDVINDIKFNYLEITNALLEVGAIIYKKKKIK